METADYPGIPISASDEMHVMGSDKNIRQELIHKVVDEV